MHRKPGPQTEIEHILCNISKSLFLKSVDNLDIFDNFDNAQNMLIFGLGCIFPFSNVLSYGISTFSCTPFPVKMYVKHYISLSRGSELGLDLCLAIDHQSMMGWQWIKSQITSPQGGSIIL